MDRLEAMQVFVAVAESGGFAAAARRVGTSPPSVTRAVAWLEERIGTELFKRTTRSVRMTEAGERFLADCRRILGELEEAERFAGDLHGELRGRLAVTAPATFGRLYVSPIVLEYLALHSLASVRTFFVDRLVDMIDEGLDVAVRIAELPDSTLTAVRVGSVRRVVCASPRYLAEHGVPHVPRDLAEHDAVVFGDAFTEPEWVFERTGRRLAAPLRARLVVNTVDLALAAALAGRGVARFLSYQVEVDVRAGRLRVVLPEHEPVPLPVHVGHTGGKRASAKVRAFVDLAVERLRAAGFS
jgi:DNA-binding transcriptional LysR family regulator